MKMTGVDRLLLLATVLLASYQIVVGINNLGTMPITAYTIGFGVLLVAGLLLFILGFEALDSPVVVTVSTVIPLAISLGLVGERMISYQLIYLFFAILGFLAVLITRSIKIPSRLPAVVLTIVHGTAGLTIFLLPVLTSIQGRARPTFALVGLGGALIGLDGLLLSFSDVGRAILPRQNLIRTLPIMLFLMTAAFVAGFNLG